MFHDHRESSGYLRKPEVNTFNSNPFLLLKRLTVKYSSAVINVIKTCKGGKKFEQGAKRFKKEVLIYQPDILFIDYALNDRVIG